MSKQITLGYAVMFFLILVISGLSLYSIYRLDKVTSNIEGRFTTLSNLLSKKERTPEPLRFEDKMIAEIRKITNDQVKYAYINVFTVGLIALLFGGILTLMVPRVITKPISRLVNATKWVASGDYSYRIKNPSGGAEEISSLIGAFNDMLENIECRGEENAKLLEETRALNQTLEARVEEATREIKEKQAQMIKSERLAAIGELVAGIVHEIRNPLSGIAVALGLMKNEVQELEHKQTIADVLKEIDRLNRIIKNLLQYAQLAHPRKLNLVETDPNEVVERVIGLMNPTAQEKGIEVEKKLNPTEPFRVDPDQIEQVVMNLIINGIDAMNSHGKLTVETQNADGYILIKVSDTGHGLSEEVKEKIFRPFYSTKPNGTGLGLSISLGIVEMHEGKILISGEKDKGSTFTVMIPVNLRSESGI
ncbi:MAG: ATP-binding protein [Ignavibacteriales bacterium]